MAMVPPPAPHTHTFVVVIGEPVNATVCVKPWAAVASVGDVLLAGVARVVVVHDTTWFEWDVEQDAVVTHLALVVWHGVEVTGDVVAQWRMAHGEVVGTNTVVADMVGNTNTFSVTVFVGGAAAVVVVVDDTTAVMQHVVWWMCATQHLDCWRGDGAWTPHRAGDTPPGAHKRGQPACTQHWVHHGVHHHYTHQQQQVVCCVVWWLHHNTNHTPKTR